MGFKKNHIAHMQLRQILNVFVMYYLLMVDYS